VSNGSALFGTELGWESYRPDDAVLAGMTVPIQLAVGRDTSPFFQEAVSWLAERVDARVHELPGAHVPMFTHPDDLRLCYARCCCRLAPGEARHHQATRNITRHRGMVMNPAGW
jgi:pimeloyl-ACP methyl ester carboxylesterase